MIEEHQWFGEARALLQNPHSPSTWAKLGELVLDAHNERWFATHALPYLENSLRRWPDQMLTMPASWSDELTGKLRVALELQRSEGIPWTNVMRGRWEHFSLAKNLVLPARAWEDPFELMELLRRCTSLANIKIIGGSLGMREVSSLRHVPSLRAIDLLETSWSFDDLRGGDTLFEIWPELTSFATGSVGTRRKATERFEATLRAERTLDTLRIHPPDSVGTAAILTALGQKTPRHLDLGEFATWMYPSAITDFSHKVLEGRGASMLSTLSGVGLLHGGLERLHVRSSERVATEVVSLEPLVKSGASNALLELEIDNGGLLLEDLSPLHACEKLESLELGKTSSRQQGKGGLETIRDPLQDALFGLLEASDLTRWRRLGLAGLLTLEIPNASTRMAALLARMTHLEQFDASDCCTETGVLANLLSSGNLADLSVLDWSRNALDMGDIEALANLLAGRAAFLDLSGCDLDDDKLEALLDGIGSEVLGLQVHDNPLLSRRGYDKLLDYASSHPVRLLGCDLSDEARSALDALLSPLESIEMFSLGGTDTADLLAAYMGTLPYLEQVILPHQTGATTFYPKVQLEGRWVAIRCGESALRARREVIEASLARGEAEHLAGRSRRMR